MHTRLTIIVFLLLAAVTAKAQYTEEEHGYWRKPIAAGSGIVVTDNEASALWFVSGDSVRALLRAPGCGNDFVLTPGGESVGFKLIDASGRQVPALLNLLDGSVQELDNPGARVGMPSFADDGTVAYTMGDNLVVKRTSTVETIPLGSYANLAPISPDGRYVAWNSEDDQIWIIDLRDGTRTHVSAPPAGYFHPVWSPDASRLLFSSLSGNGFVFDLGTQKVYDLGEAHAPVWMPDSRTVLFHRLETDGMTLKNADIFAASWDGTVVQNITSTPDVVEMDASYDAHSGAIVFQTYARQEICEQPVTPGTRGLPRLQQGAQRVVLRQLPTIEHQPRPSLRKSLSITTLDIPYVHQRYDTPDWHNGSGSCAPTAAMMVLAYYGILPPWPTYCSTPYVHWNNWGGYVADKYQFRGVDYALFQTTDNGGNVTWGAYGYMWKTGSPYSRMLGFYQKNGMTASQTDNTPHNIAMAEIQAGRPFTMCVLLTTAGHVVIAHGVGAEAHTFVFNDPYGDKNQGYMNYYGKNVQYDWPGYNNGHQNLTEVAWCIATSFNPFAKADTTVDDLQFEKGFHMSTSQPASMTLWRDTLAGVGGHSWYTSTTATNTCFATWTPDLPQYGLYEVQAFVPPGSTAPARYVLTHAGGKDTVLIDQAASAGSWVSLGRYSFNGNGSVGLGTGSIATGSRLGFDAIRWSYQGTEGVNRAGSPAIFSLGQNYPNPFNPSTRLVYEIGQASFVTLEVYDVLGRRIAVLADGDRQPGTYHADWNAGNSAAGMYLAVLTARESGGFVRRTVQKMTLLR